MQSGILADVKRVAVPDGRRFELRCSDTTSGSLKTIVQFSGGSEGAKPSSNLTLVGGKLYGTTELGEARTRGRSTRYRDSKAGATSDQLRILASCPHGFAFARPCLLCALRGSPVLRSLQTRAAAS